MRESANRGIRIAKFTLDGYFNYGNVLQNYALQQMLLRYADSVDTLWTQPYNFMPEVWLNWRWKEYIGSVYLVLSHFSCCFIQSNKTI